MNCWCRRKGGENFFFLIIYFGEKNNIYIYIYITVRFPKTHFSSHEELLLWDLWGYCTFLIFSSTYQRSHTYCQYRWSKVVASFNYQAYWRSRRKLEIHVGTSPHQRNLRGSKLSLVTVIKFTTNWYSWL